MHLPVWTFFVVSTQANELIFDKVGYDGAQAHRSLFAVGEASHIAPGDQWLTISSTDMDQDTRCVANESEWLVGTIEGLQQCDGVGIRGQVPQGAMAARVEHSIEI